MLLFADELLIFSCHYGWLLRLLLSRFSFIFSVFFEYIFAFRCFRFLRIFSLKFIRHISLLATPLYYRFPIQIFRRSKSFTYINIFRYFFKRKGSRREDTDVSAIVLFALLSFAIVILLPWIHYTYLLLPFLSSAFHTNTISSSFHKHIAAFFWQ
jgi:hypothetical protein